MGRIQHPVTKDGFPNLSGKCRICGATAAAYWHGSEGCLEVCTYCAEDVLPALIADAVFLPNAREHDAAKQKLVTITKSYWKAMFSRALRHSKGLM